MTRDAGMTGDAGVTGDADRGSHRGSPAPASQVWRRRLAGTASQESQATAHTRSFSNTVVRRGRAGLAGHCRVAARCSRPTIGQEQRAKEILARLDKLNSRDEEFDRLLAEYIPAARQHIAFEETRVWPGLRQARSETEAQDLGGKIQAAEGKGPARPHPHTPPSPGVLKSASVQFSVKETQ